MSDPRREAVARAICEAAPAVNGSFDLLTPRWREIHLREADAALAAIDAAEPTTDEIIAAAEAMEEICPSLRDAYPDGPDYTAPIVLAKAALIAARKAVR